MQPEAELSLAELVMESAGKQLTFAAFPGYWLTVAVAVEGFVAVVAGFADRPAASTVLEFGHFLAMSDSFERIQAPLVMLENFQATSSVYFYEALAVLVERSRVSWMATWAALVR